MYEVSKSTDTGWWFAKKSRNRAKNSMPTISAPTPMLLIKARSRTPMELIKVVETRVSSPTNCHMSRPGIGDALPRSKPMIVDSTSGTVAATAVTVTTPAQK